MTLTMTCTVHSYVYIVATAPVQSRVSYYRQSSTPVMSCGCCSPLRPRYKRLVDNIYPAYQEDGLDTANMQKLIYYAATSPEKWDRIGEYLSSRINRDLNRNYPRHGFVTIGMEAMDELLKTCPSHYLNLYVESYLKTVQKLLESPDPDMQVNPRSHLLLASSIFILISLLDPRKSELHQVCPEGAGPARLPHQI